MEILEISQSHLKEISKLKLKKYREKSGFFLIESEKILIEALSSDWHIDEIFLTERNIVLIEKFIKYSKFKNQKIYQLNEREFKKISSETTPSGVAALVLKKNFDLESIFIYNNHIPVFERISDPGNLGTIIRSAAWFGFKSIVLSKESVELTNPKVIKASMGSIFHLNIYEKTDLHPFLLSAKQEGYKVLGTTPRGRSISELNFEEKCILIFGNESSGISDSIKAKCDDLVSIPAFGKAESLNIAVSASIFFYEISKKKYLGNNIS